ncbi:Fc.00g104230.m01.CDS01 [Cosmosporella sp. VM-42]
MTGQHNPGNKLRNGAKASKAKVKSGCRTCKIRKVKCDEGRPACTRCQSTGRVCDGYGIWGGGGKSYNHPSHRSCTGPNRQKLPALIKAASAAEYDCLQWFMFRTARKLPGVFSSSFWDTLVLRATYSEPAVLHAVLALGSVHRRESINGDGSKRAEGVPDAQEQFTLRQYNQAIHQLQPHFSIKNKSSIRVALITCIVFMCLEFIRGRYELGNKHLKNGMKLLNNITSNSDNATTRISKTSLCQEPTDDWLIEAFTRMNLQATLLGQGSRCLDGIPHEIDSQPLPVIFTSMSQARASSDRLMSRIHYLAEICRQSAASSDSTSHPTHLLDSQQRIQSELELWFRTYVVSRVNMQVDTGIAGIIAYKLLGLHHIMATIMAHVCLSVDDESCFDSHTDDFVVMIEQSIDLVKTIQSTDLSNTPFDHKSDISPFVADLGWIPPLYYTATKCRIHRIRVQAIKLLGSISSKEGIWDGFLTASIAWEIMLAEEGGFYDYTPLADDFPLHSSPTEQDLTKPILPESSRIHGLRVALPMNSTNKAIISGKRKQGDGSWEVIRRECTSYSGS